MTDEIHLVSKKPSDLVFQLKRLCSSFNLKLKERNKIHFNDSEIQIIENLSNKEGILSDEDIEYLYSNVSFLSRLFEYFIKDYFNIYSISNLSKALKKIKKGVVFPFRLEQIMVFSDGLKTKDIFILIPKEESIYFEISDNFSSFISFINNNIKPMSYFYYVLKYLEAVSDLKYKGEEKRFFILKEVYQLLEENNDSFLYLSKSYAKLYSKEVMRSI